MRRIVLVGAVTCVLAIGAALATAPRAGSQPIGTEHVDFCLTGDGNVTVTGTGFELHTLVQVWLYYPDFSNTSGYTAPTTDGSGAFNTTFPASLLPLTAFLITDGNYVTLYGPVPVDGLGACLGGGPAPIASQVILTPSTNTPQVATPITLNGQLADANGVPVAQEGIEITFYDGNNNVVGSCTTDATGQCSKVVVVGNTAGGTSFSANIPGGTGTFGGSLQMTALPGPWLAGQATITASPTSIPADGVSISTITVQALDQYGNAVHVSVGTLTLVTNAGTLGLVRTTTTGHTPRC